MPRRAGWMHDYEMSLDQNVSSPANRDLLKQILTLLKTSKSQNDNSNSKQDINININLGDLLNKAVNTKSHESSIKELIDLVSREVNRLDEDE